MRILIATALFPPDIAPPAPYLKELAARLATNHQVHVLTYGEIPEQVPHATLTAISKKSFAPLRLLRFTVALYRAAASTDVVVVQNGMSVELPTALVGVRWRRKIIHMHSDPKALPSDSTSLPARLLYRLAHWICPQILSLTYPPARPEILPFSPHPDEALTAYEAAWQHHLATLQAALETFYAKQ